MSTRPIETAVATAAAMAAALLVGTAGSLSAQATGYPSKPVPLPEAQEIALARSAAPKEVSGDATVYVLRASGPAVAKQGTNGFTCIVSRDLHPGSLYPMCFDPEATRTMFPRQLMELRLRFEGKTEPQVKEAVQAAIADKTLPTATKAAITYMMSPHQVLFSSPDADGRRVGAWHPHLMIVAPGATAESLGLGPDGMLGDIVMFGPGGESASELVVPVATWADSTARR